MKLRRSHWMRSPLISGVVSALSCRFRVNLSVTISTWRTGRSARRPVDCSVAPRIRGAHPAPSLPGHRVHAAEVRIPPTRGEIVRRLLESQTEALLEIARLCRGSRRILDVQTAWRLHVPARCRDRARDIPRAIDPELDDLSHGGDDPRASRAAHAHHGNPES